MASFSMTPERSPSGIAGLDDVLHGGFPEGRCALLIGGPGSGKTVLATQFLVNGATLFDEAGILVSFEESAEAILLHSRSFGWPINEIIGTSLHIVDGRLPINTVRMGDFDLSGLLAVLADLSRKTGARRIVLDGLDALFGTAAGDVRYRELQRLLEWIDTQHLTALITMKPGIESGDSVAPRFEQAEYAADAVIRLTYSLQDRLLQRMLRVVKMRASDYAAGDHPCLISQRGFEVAYEDVNKVSPPLSTRRLSTGIERLDRMLAGGFREGSITLISGLPGTSKTTLGAAFIEATLKRGERAMIVAFDEPAEQIMADLTSVDIHLEAFRRSGLLQTASYNAGSAIADAHLLSIQRLIQTHRPAAIMFDPITALEKAGGRAVADLVSYRLANLLKSSGITAVFTAVGESRLGEIESTSARISTLADTWIHVSYSVTGGERNRTLTVIKSRGTGHSNQMRELILSDSGLTLEDVYDSGGDVLLGTARIQREQQDRLERSQRDRDRLQQMQELDDQLVLATARLTEAQRQIDNLTAKQSSSIDADELADVVDVANREVVQWSRQADPTEASPVAGTP